MYASIFHASSSAKLLGTGTLTGAIRYVGGPAPAPGTRRQPSAGWVHVQTADGKRVRVIYVQAGHRFQLKLPAGRYRVYGTEARHNGLEPGCSAQQVRVRAGQATSARLAIGCLVA